MVWRKTIYGNHQLFIQASSRADQINGAFSSAAAIYHFTPQNRLMPSYFFLLPAIIPI
jgi:hypothetical protein